MHVVATFWRVDTSFFAKPQCFSRHFRVTFHIIASSSNFLHRIFLFRLIFFGIVAATKTVNEGRMHAGRTVQEMKDELSEAERTLLAIKKFTARLIGSYPAQASE